MRRLLLAIVTAGCASHPTPRPTTKEATALTSSAQASAERRFAVTEQMTQVTCPGAAVRIEGGVERALVCPNEAAAQGLTILDLSDVWTPTLFSPQADGTAPAFRAQYLAMSAGRDADGKPLEDTDALAELYGVLPSLAIVRDRLADDARHACHAAIDSAPIALLEKPYAQDHKDQIAVADYTRTVLEHQLARLDLLDLSKIPTMIALAPIYARWSKLEDLHEGIVAAQRHLACEHFLGAKQVDGTMTWVTSNAVELFQRRNFLMPNERLDPETRDALAVDSHELDFRLALRILRERVVDATGLLEDGTASSGPQPILGRLLDPGAMRAARGGEQPLPNGAPDLVSATTEAAAKALGWTTPADVRLFLDHHKGTVRVAVALPPPPAYHSSHMDLSAEVDRGDVWYDEVPIPRKIVHRPTLIVYVNDAGTRRPLIRWPTTIGGWAEVRMPGGEVVKRWKESDVGPRVWRELYAAPTWLPPPTTPDRDLVKNLWNGHYDLKREIMGPGPHAAFGLMLLLHQQAVTLKDGTQRFDDNGIGTHGSASVTSIVNGNSHGCHRLYNQLAVRLADFLLHHREFVVRGEQAEVYRRRVNYKGSFLAKVDTRGFLYELTPPIQVTVLKGNIRSERKVPPRASAPARPD